MLGPSGSGKTTLLRVDRRAAAAGRGTRRCSTATTSRGVPPHRRGIGLVFQDHALFPHRDVAGNVGFGLRMRGDAPRRSRRARAELLDLVGLAGFEQPLRRHALGRRAAARRARTGARARAAPAPARRAARIARPPASRPPARRPRAPLRRARPDRGLRHARPGRGVRARRPRRRHARRARRPGRDAGRALGAARWTRTSRASSASRTSTATS